MKKLTIILVLVLGFTLPGCSNPAPPAGTPPKTAPEPAGIWQVGANLSYSSECIWGNTLVALETDFTNADPQNGKMPIQNIVAYDLNTREKKQISGPPEGRIMDTPAIYGNKIVFAAVDANDYFRFAVSSKIEPSPNYDVFLFDLKTNQIRQLTTEGHGQMSPRIYDTTVVWLDARNQPLNQYPPPFDIYAFDLGTNQEKRITASPTADGNSQISISGNLVVWADIRHADSTVTSHPSNDPKYNNEIYGYDLASDREQRVTNSPGNDWAPSIDGKSIVWLRQENYLKADVFMYDLDKKLETQVSHSGFAATNPSMYHNRIIWTDASSSNGNTDNDVVMNGQLPGSAIVLFDLSDQKETLLTPTEEGKVWLFPVVQGNHAVFILSRQVGGLVYAMELPSQLPP